MNLDSLTLHNAIVGGHSKEDIVATSWQHHYLRWEFWREISNLYSRLCDLKDTKYVLLSIEDGYLFVVTFCAALYAHKTPVLVGSMNPNKLSKLTIELPDFNLDERLILATEKDTVAGSFKTEGACAELLPLIVKTNSYAPNIEDDFTLPPPSNDSAVIFFTSGSSGTPKCIIKPLSSLEQDIRNFCGFSAGLEAFENCSTSCDDYCHMPVVVSTVPCYHMYGITFRVMMPLLRNIPFYSGTITYTEELTALRYPLILVSSPAFLGRIDFNLSAPSIVYTLSAGAKFDRKDALSFYKWSSCKVTEIYGSTEANIMAYRYNCGDDSLFTPAPFVRFFYQDETLYIDSKTLLHPLKLDDELIFKDKGFMIKGRRDTIVKIAENRVSLTFLENCIKDFDSAIVDVRAVPFYRGTRQFIGLVLLVADINAFKTAPQRHAYRKKLAYYLRNYIPQVAIPRHLRFLEEFPKNSMGKVLQSELKRLFDD